MTRHLLVSTAIFTVFAASMQAPAHGQAIPPMGDEEARLVQAAAAARAGDPILDQQNADGFENAARAAFPAPATQGASVTPEALVATLKGMKPALESVPWKRSPVVAVDPAMLSAQDKGNGVAENRYFMMMLSQTFDGRDEHSIAQKAGFARLRKGDESWVTVNFGDGAIVRASAGQVAGAHFSNVTPTEIRLAYDYRTQTLRGNPRVADYHNRYVRPLLNRSPALGRDASWVLAVTPAQLGVKDVKGGALKIAFRRHYFMQDGRPYVLVEYNAPAFSYVDATGEKVTHRARGAALADPGFGQIYWSGTLHSAAATPVTGGAPRPYRFARTFYAMDAGGRPLVDLSAIPVMTPLLAHFHPKETARAGPAGGTSIAKPDQTPLRFAALLDIAALSITENSANQMGETDSAFLQGDTGTNIATAATDAFQRNLAYLNESYEQSPFKDLVDAYGNPDKFMAAFGAYASREGDNFTASLQAALTNIEKQAQTISAWTGSLQRKAASLRTEYATVTRTAQQIRDQLRTAESVEQLLNGSSNVRMGTIEALEKRSKDLMRQISAIDGQIRAEYEFTRKLASQREAIEAITEDSSRFMQTTLRTLVQSGRASSSLVTKFSYFAQTLNKALEVTGAAHVLATVGGINNAAGVYQTATNLGNFDPERAGDLELTGNYDGAFGQVSDIALNMLGIIGNAASGNPVTTMSDVLTYASGRFTDLYMAYQAAQAAQGQAQYAEAQYQLTLHRYALQMLQSINTDKAAIRAGVDSLDRKIKALEIELASRRPGPLDDPARNPPSFDPQTGLPTISYWMYLKEHDPQKLRQMGIDPTAPVGVTPPGWQRPRTPTAAQAAAEPEAQPRIPTDPGYPTARPRPRNADAAPSGRTETAQAEPNEPDDGQTVDRDRAAQDREPVRTVERDQPTRIDDNPVTTQGPPVVDFTPVGFDPVTFDPVTFDPVEFDPVTFDPVTWDPPEWVPVEYEPDEASEIPWTDFDDSNDRDWGNDIDNLAFDYGDMEGQVATDLSAYESWLKTQNQTFLEQLARTAGYPNLASALNDSASLIRKANDPGFYTWAWSPPAVSGAIGIQFSEGQHEMGRAAYMLGDLLKRSGLFDANGEPTAQLVEGSAGLDDPSLQSLNGGAYGPDSDRARLADMAYSAGYRVQRDSTGRLGSESGGALAASLFDLRDPYLRRTTTNGRGGLNQILAQPFNVILTWGAGAYDLDLHMTGPLGSETTDRFHIYFAARGNLEQQPFAELIKDCICNSGSEVILTSALNRGGVYRVSAFNYGDQGASSTNLSAQSGARIQIVRGGTTQSVGNGTTIVGGRTILSTSVPAGGAGNSWVAVELDPRSGRITVPNRIVQSSGSGGVQ